MKIDNTDFSFDESLKYLDELVVQLQDTPEIPVCNTLTDEDLPPRTVVAVNCTAMCIKVNNKTVKDGKVKEYILHAAMNLIIKILASSKTIKHLHLQADGGLLAIFDTPMKRDVEDVINLSAQVRSINEVVLKKFHIMDLAAQVVTVGIDYGPVTCYCAGTSLDEYYLAGQSIETAKLLTSATQDCVNISNNIYINLPEDMTTKLFTSQGFVENMKYYYSPLINIRMRKWVAEQG